MSGTLAYAVLAAGSYLAGAIPSGYVLVKLRTGKDIRTLGSGNVGATNVARVLGTGWFVPVFVVDFLKGFAPVFWAAPWVASRWPLEGRPELGTALAVLSGMLALTGHLWPVTIGFRGGKGVATVGGLLFAMNWAAALIAMAVWVLAFLPWRYVSLGSVVAAVALPVANHFTADLVRPRYAAPWIITAFLGVAGLLVIWRHRENLRRLVRGEERKFGARAES
jgi:glycerol-3-phosphate acyltransferase PlsY